MTRRKRWRPPWPVQLAGVFAACAAAALTWTVVLMLVGMRR